MVEQKHPKIVVSVPTFHEIAAALEKIGIKSSDAKTLLLEKGSDLQPPIDWRLANVRKDSVDIASKVIEYYPDGTQITSVADEIYNYIVNDTKPNEPEPELTPQTVNVKTGWQ